MRLSRPAKAALVGILVIVILGVASSIARANQQCGTPAFSGASRSGPIVVTVNPDTGTWTALKIRGALACMVDAGDGGKVAPVRPNA